jgi:predicted RecB family nuclease
MSIPGHDSKSEEVVKKRARYLFTLYIVVAVAIVYVVVSLAGILIGTWEGHDTRKTLVDCVEPHGKCYRNGTERTKKAIQQLIEANQLDEVATRRVVIIAVTCQQLPGVSTLDEVQACVDERLKLEKKGTEGSANE